MKQIKTFKLFPNNNKKSKNIENIVKQKLLENDFYECDDYDLAIAIGGDGSFLRMIKVTNFNSNVLYVGINAGTLGFTQEVSIENIDSFIEDIKNNNYKIDKIGIQQNKIHTHKDDSNFYSLNEMVIRDADLNTATLKIEIDNIFLEEYHGDGILISTSFGSTAYNLSFGGSIIFNTFHTLQITPIAPLNNKSYRSLINSVVIPDNKIVKITPNNKNLLITIDGENIKYENIEYIETYVGNKTIQCIRSLDYNFAEKINEKFLK